MAGKINKNKCARGFEHELEKVAESKTHIRQQCKKCKGHFFKPRRN